MLFPEAVHWQRPLLRVAMKGTLGILRIGDLQAAEAAGLGAKGCVVVDLREGGGVLDQMFDILRIAVNGIRLCQSSWQDVYLILPPVCYSWRQALSCFRWLARG